MRTYSETRSTVQMQRHFRHESDIPRHGRIPSCNAILKWADDFNVRDSVVNKSVGPAHPSCTPEKSVDDDDGVFDVLIFSGEVHFHLSRSMRNLSIVRKLLLGVLFPCLA
jgi:hypothetical protein